MAITDEQAAHLINRVDAAFDELIAAGISKDFVAGEMMARGYSSIFCMDRETSRGQISLLLRNLTSEIGKTLNRAQRRSAN
jgi:hypothetical protein